MNIMELSKEFAAERDARRAAFPPNHDASTCRYCGKARTVYPGSRLDGHMLCMVSREFANRLAAVVDADKLPFITVAEALGMTISVVRRWYRAGKGWPAV